MKKVPTVTDGLEVLKDKVVGSDALSRLRGNLPKDFVEKILERGSSPSEFCRMWDQFSRDCRTIGNILSQLKRDGMSVAADELRFSLHDANYPMIGEDPAEDELQDVTVLVLDWQRTLTMIRWIRASHWHELDNYLDGDKTDWMTEDLFRLFGSLKKHSLERQSVRAYEGCDLIAAYYENVRQHFEKDLSKLSPHADLGVCFQTYNDHLEVGKRYGGVFAHVYHEDQATVLSCFTREVQRRLSTWQFRLPKKILDKDLLFGFQPESDQEYWKHRQGAFTSMGCQNGYGASCLYRNRIDRDDYLDHHNPVRKGGGMIELESPEEPFHFILSP